LLWEDLPPAPQQLIYDRACYMPNGLSSITFLSYFNNTHNLLSYIDEEFALVRRVSRIFLVLVTGVITYIDLPPRTSPHIVRH